LEKTDKEKKRVVGGREVKQKQRKITTLTFMFSSFPSLPPSLPLSFPPLPERPLLCLQLPCIPSFGSHQGPTHCLLNQVRGRREGGRGGGRRRRRGRERRREGIEGAVVVFLEGGEGGLQRRILQLSIR
jgi:hypothetical protein